MHAWDASPRIEETLRFLDDAVTRRQDRLLRLLQLPGLAGHQGRAHRAARGWSAAGHAAAAVQPPRARHRARGRPGLPRRRHGPAALVAAGRRLARAASTSATWRRPARLAPRREPRARHGGLRGRATPRRAPGTSSTRWREVASERGVILGAGGAGLGGGPAGGHLGHPRAPARSSSSPTTWAPPTSTSTPEQLARLDEVSAPRDGGLSLRPRRRRPAPPGGAAAPLGVRQPARSTPKRVAPRALRPVRAPQTARPVRDRARVCRKAERPDRSTRAILTPRVAW